MREALRVKGSGVRLDSFCGFVNMGERIACGGLEEGECPGFTGPSFEVLP